jgi:NAD(P)-dependent dehydrogenase (short-subunit alcohol dehydrogenase family)
MNEFEDKVVIVTGAASGIGLAIAQAFATKGATVCGVDISSDGMSAAVESSQEMAGEIRAYIADVSSVSDVESCMQSIIRDVEHIDILVNNAGINMAKRIQALEVDDWDRTFDTNLRSVYLFCKQVWDLFVAQQRGVIVNMSSVMGQQGGVGSPAYCAAKSAIIMLTRCLAKDGAPDGIRVNAVCPGYIDTPIMEKVFAEQEDPEAARQAVIDLQPMGRMGSGADIANGVLFLASDQASFISGTSLTIDGAVTATQID